MASVFLIIGFCFLVVATFLLSKQWNPVTQKLRPWMSGISLGIGLFCVGLGQSTLSHPVDIIFSAIVLLAFAVRKPFLRFKRAKCSDRSALLIGIITIISGLSFTLFFDGLLTTKLIVIVLLGLLLAGTVLAKFMRLRAWMLAGLFTLSTLITFNIDLLFSQPALAATENFAAGAYVIDMGQATQTVANGLKPYGLVYDLVVKKGIPVKWAIAPAKARDGVDFTAAGKNYSGGSFIIPAAYATDAATTVAAWRAQGVVVDGPLPSSFAAPIYTNIDNFPNTVLDSANGAITQTYFTNAGIPASTTGVFGSFTTYQFLPPSALNACNDVYVMPHADPTWAVHQNLIPFNQSKGFIWAACHAVSVLERVDDPGDADLLPDMNFLSHVPPAVQDSPSLKLFGKHIAPTAGPYQYNNTTVTPLPYGYGSNNLWAYPIMQFLGKIDLATQNGSEQLYVPENTSQWRDTTAIATYDSTATAADPGLNSNSQDKAVKMVFGPGFGQSNRGLVMYEAGHSHAKAILPDNIAAQRAFLNFILLAGVVRGIDTQVNAPTQINAGQTVNASVTATGGTGIYSYQWYSSCGGTFSNPNSATTSFTAPANPGTCTLRVAVTDTCTRKSIGALPTTILGPQADLAITKTDNQTTATIGSPMTYTITVTNNGPSIVNSLTVTDNVPATILNPVFTPSTGGFSYNTTTKVGTWTGLSLAAGQSVTLTVTGTVSGTAVVGGSIVNTATVAPLGGLTDSNSNNDSATDTDSIVAPTANITVTKDDGVTQTSQDGNLSYTIRVTNNGPDTVTSIKVEDQIINFKDDASTPAQGVDTTTPDKGGKDVMDKLTLSVSQGTLSATPTAFDNNTDTMFTSNFATLTWQNVNLAPGQSAVLTLSGQVKVNNNKGALRNTVRLTPLASSGTPMGSAASASDTDNMIARVTEVALNITKSTTPASPIPGSNITYTLLVENSKNAADDARIIDNLPLAITNGTWNCAITAGSSPTTQCNVPSGTLTSGNLLDTTADLANGGKVTYTITGQLDPSFTGSLVNTATVTPKPGQYDNTPADNTSTVTNTAAPRAALIVQKDNGLTTVAPGQALTYQITVKNNGPSTIRGFKLTETIPDWIQNPIFAVGQGTFSPTKTDGTPNDIWTGDWTNLNLIPGNPTTDRVTLTVTGTLSSSATPGTNNLTNTVTVAAIPGYTLDTANSTLSANDVDSIQATADLEITKTDNQTTTIPGKAIGYLLTVKNNGPSSVNSVTVTDTLPPTIQGPIVFTPTEGTYDASTGLWTGLNLAAGQSTTLTVEGTVSPTATGTLANTATVAPPAGVVDSINTNNSSTDTDTLTPTADLSITKTDGNTAINIGETITYQITVSNLGPSAVSGATVTDNIPNDITNVNWTCAVTGTGSCGATNGTGNTLNTTVSLSPNAVATYTVIGTVSSGSNLTNTAQIASPMGMTDPNTTNNSATDVTAIGRPTGQVDLSVTKTNNQTSVVPGSPVSYEITVTNNGPGTVDNIKLTDTLPSDLLNPFFSTPNGTYDPTTGAWTDLNLAPGDSVSLLIDADLSISPSASRLTNVAVVQPPIGFTDPVSNNNSSTDDDPISGITTSSPNLLLVKRITAINSQSTNDGKDLAAYIDTASPYDDNTITVTDPLLQADTDKWPVPLTDSLKGEVDAGNVKPGDEVEYTIYYLSAGSQPAMRVLFCDPLPSNATYVSGSLSLSHGGVNQTLTDAEDADQGQYVLPGNQPTGLPNQLASCNNHSNGVVVVNLGNIRNATSPGSPADSYGYVRLRGRAK
jgi:uncharacterized repeat protein (TIGR01451 family)